jgi:hypothetical protein
VSGGIDTERTDTVCPHCGQTNVPEARFCDRCGRSLVAAKSPRRRTPIVLGLFAVVLVSALAVWLALGRKEGPSTESASAAASPTPTLQLADPELAEAVGERLTFKVWDQALVDPECAVHTFPDAETGQPEGVYLSDCHFWERKGYELYLFEVGLVNDSDAPVDAKLENFVITDQDGRTHRPVSLFDFGFETVSEDIPKTETIPPDGGLLTGWMYVEGEREFVPASLTYRDQGESLTVTFTGKHDTRLPVDPAG